jgi:hypothetical protein
MQETAKPDSMSIGSAHPEAGVREAQAEAGQEAAGGVGGPSQVASQVEGTQIAGDPVAEGEDPVPPKDAAQHSPPAMRQARPLPHLPLMREV